MKLKKDQKIFVLDTNVPLYDYSCIFSFKDNIVVVPITLLEEIDKFKKGNELINFNAREFTRQLEDVIGDKEPDRGVNLPNGGLIMITTNIKKNEKLAEVFAEDTPDHRILSVAYNFSEVYGSTRVILVTKDINLRMKAKSIGLKAEDYETGKVKNIVELYTLAYYSYQDKIVKLVEKKRAYGIQPKNAEQIFSLHALINPMVELVTLSGKAGTGKTLMALAAA